jgi:hypothetical protein
MRLEKNIVGKNGITERKNKNYENFQNYKISFLK